MDGVGREGYQCFLRLGQLMFLQLWSHLWARQSSLFYLPRDFFEEVNCRDFVLFERRAVDLDFWLTMLARDSSEATDSVSSSSSSSSSYS